MERNLLELPHEGFALGADIVAAHRYGWEDWGRNAAESGREGADFLTGSLYAFVASRVPGAPSERHRIVASFHAGAGADVDRFSSLRIGGGPQGEEYLALARPILPGAVIDEFFPEHYAVLIAEYRWEPIFFSYVGPRASVGFLDRDRRRAQGVMRENDVFASAGARLTTGFAGDLRIQIDYNFSFGVIRRGDFGGHEIVLQVSREL
jgi:hypothetical protein